MQADLFEKVFLRTVKQSSSRVYYPKAPGYVKGSETSKEAAESVEKHVTGLARKVLDFIEARGKWGATSDEIEIDLDMRHQTASARVRELFLKNKIDRTEIKRKTRSGRNAFVYRVREGV